MQKLIVLAALLFAAFSIGGCAKQRMEDGREALVFQWPFADNEAGDRAAASAAGSLGSAVGGALFGPIGAVIGEYSTTGIAGAVLAAVGWFSGRNRGWDENDDYHGRKRPGRARGGGAADSPDPPGAAQPATA